jgi:hypothetical protein
MTVFPTLDGLGCPVTRRQINKTRIQTSASGREMRATYWRHPKFEFDLTFNYLTAADYDALAGFFAARQGQLDSFYFDAGAGDNSVTDEPLDSGTGGAHAFRLERSLGSRVLPVDASFGDRTASVNGSPATAKFRNIPAGDNLIITGDFADSKFHEWQVTHVDNPRFTDAPASVPFGRLAYLQWDGIGSYMAFTTGHESDIPVSEGQQIYCSGWLSTGTSATGCDMGVSFFDDGGGAVAGGKLTVPAGENTAFYEQNFTVPANATTMRAGTIHLSGPQSGDAIRVGPQLTTIDTRIACVAFDTAPSKNASVKWSGGYYYRVRFKDEELELEEFMSQIYSGDSITLRSL